MVTRYYRSAKSGQRARQSSLWWEARRYLAKLDNRLHRWRTMLQRRVSRLATARLCTSACAPDTARLRVAKRMVKGRGACVVHQLRKASCILGKEQCNTNVQRQHVCAFA